jgi:hypothetical protein
MLEIRSYATISGFDRVQGWGQHLRSNSLQTNRCDRVRRRVNVTNLQKHEGATTDRSVAKTQVLLIVITV